MSGGWGCMVCGGMWTGRKIEHCTVCHQTFSTTAVGDAHRVGSHGVKTGPDRRRCLTADEFAALTNRAGVIRFRLNDRGVWIGAIARTFAGAGSVTR